MNIFKTILSWMTPRRNDCSKSSSVDRDNMDIPDKLTLARMDIENQGPWEAEYFYGDEYDLYQHYNNCKKNPGHKDFIPVDTFSIEDLPEEFRHQDVMDYIRAESDLTVRVTVRYVSDGRPARVPGSDKPYPGYDYRGQQRMTVGTGWVHYIQRFSDKDGDTCKCKDCQNSSTPETEFGTIGITTTKHVVFDDLEAEHTTCHLFFDNGDTPDTCSGVVTLTGMSIRYTQLENDQCCMNHFTHDLDLARRLHQTRLRRDELRKAISTRLPKIKVFTRRPISSENELLAIIVSHPHGCRKHISIGQCVSLDDSNQESLSYNYTTATCPGSSGAPVYMPYALSQLRQDEGWDIHIGIHCGTSDVQPGINYCQIKKGNRMKQRKYLSVDRLALNTEEVQETMYSVDEPATGAIAALSDRGLSFIASHLGGNWTTVLIQLRVPLVQIQQLHNSYQHDVHLQIMSALRLWRDNDTRSPEDKLNCLFEVLDSDWIGYNELVERCKERFNL